MAVSSISQFHWASFCHDRSIVLCFFRASDKGTYPRTSKYLPPLPSIAFSCRPKSPQGVPWPSSSIRLVQSDFPVEMTTCCAHGAIDPLRVFLRSMFRPAGVSAQAHVGDGHLDVIGNGVEADVTPDDTDDTARIVGIRMLLVALTIGLT